MYKWLFFISVSTLALSCKKDNSGNLGSFQPTPFELYMPNQMLPAGNFPTDNPITQDKFYLGRKLFYANELSLDGSINCASCHQQQYGFSDPRIFSIGVNGKKSQRHSMALANLAWQSNGFFWDGRSDILRHQVLEPIQNPVEMNEKLERVLQKLQTNHQWRLLFKKAFGSEEITEEKLAKALEAFLYSLVSEDSKFDRFSAGKVPLTESENRGRILFYGEYNPFFPQVSGADCFHCHGSNNFEVDLFENNGLDTDGTLTDIGRQLVTGNPMDRGKFKVPSLRNVAVTAPYMHDGRFKTLREVIDHYDHGIKPSSTLNLAIQATAQTGLMLNEQEKTDLINFLHTLTDYTFLNDARFSDPN